MKFSTEQLPPMEKNKHEGLVFDTPEKVECLRTRIYELVDKTIKGNIQTLIFLDRSARPLSWAFRVAWQQKMQKKPLPEILFLNFGQEKQDLVQYAGGRENLSYAISNRKSAMEDELENLQESGQSDELKKKIKEFEEYGQISEFRDWHPFTIELSEFGKALILEEEFYRKFFNQNIVDKWTTRFKQRGKVLFVDDYSHTGGTQKTLEKMFEYNFPKVPFNFYSIFKKEDVTAFPIPTGRGFLNANQVILPWTLVENKALTMMADEKSQVAAASLTSEVEKDIGKRARALALKKEIKSIFSK